MENNKIAELKTLSTYSLAFNLAMNKYDAETKLEVLNIIQERETGDALPVQSITNTNHSVKKAKEKLPLQGSKAEKIYNFLKEGKTAKQIFDIMNKGKKKPYVYHPEIYRIGKDYFPERFSKK